MSRSGRWAVRRRTSPRARRSRRGSASRRPASRSSTSSRSAPSAGFSLAIRISSSSSSRCAGGSGSGPGPGNSLPNRSSRRPLVRAKPLLEVGERGCHRTGSSVGLVAGDQQVRDLVEESQGRDLACPDRRLAGLPSGVHPCGESPDGGDVGDDQVAADAEHRPLEAVAVTRVAADMEGTGTAHRQSMAWHRSRRPSEATPARRRAAQEMSAVSAGRSSVTCSMARRSSSSPDGSKS